MHERAIETALSLIEHADGSDVADFSGPRTEEAVATAEHELDCRFPSSYREFLKRLGCGDAHGFELFGLAGGGGIPDVVWLTKRVRDKGGLPSSLVIVSEDGMGGYYVLDTTNLDRTGECPVRVWEQGAGLTEHVADSFGDFLLELMKSDWT